MSTSTVDINLSDIENVSITDDTLSIDLSDGRTISVPLDWFPRLVHATSAERNKWRLIGKRQGIHWDELDEDISLVGILAGQPSGESQSSFNMWLQSREQK